MDYSSQASELLCRDISLKSSVLDGRLFDPFHCRITLTTLLTSYHLMAGQGLIRMGPIVSPNIRVGAC
jgi:hypothetical protein